MVEQGTHKPLVVSSSLTLATNFMKQAPIARWAFAFKAKVASIAIGF